MEEHRYWRDSKRLRLLQGDAGYEIWHLAKFSYRSSVGAEVTRYLGSLDNAMQQADIEAEVEHVMSNFPVLAI